MPRTFDANYWNNQGGFGAQPTFQPPAYNGPRGGSPMTSMPQPPFQASPQQSFNPGGTTGGNMAGQMPPGIPQGWVPDPTRTGGVRPWDSQIPGFDPTHGGPFYKPGPGLQPVSPGAPPQSAQPPDLGGMWYGQPGGGPDAQQGGPSQMPPWMNHPFFQQMFGGGQQNQMQPMQSPMLTIGGLASGNYGG
jgi:hypothetical protein